MMLETRTCTLSLALLNLSSELMSVCCSPELYFVKVDVKACFDTIKQDKLLGLVEEILSDVSFELATQLLSSN